MRIWWQMRPEREKWLIGAAVFLFVLVVFLQMAALPLLRFRAEAVRHHASEHILHAAIMAALDNGAPRPDASMRTLIAEEAAHVRLYPDRFLPGENGQVTVWLSAVPPTDLYVWLRTLRNDHAITVIEASLRRSPNGETLEASVAFARR